MKYKKPTKDTPQGTLVYGLCVDRLDYDYPLKFICINSLDEAYPYVVLEDNDRCLNAYDEVFFEEEEEGNEVEG